ncbi:MAG: effector-associated domain EAD1-containing protein [Chloroflexota bacterium]
MSEAIEMQEVLDAILDGYTRESFAQVLSIELSKDLSTYSAQGATFQEAAFSVIQGARREGWQGDLIYALQRGNPGNPLIGSLSSGEIAVGSEMAERYSGELEIRVGRLESAMDSAIDRIERLSNIVTGPDGGNGIRAEVRELRRAIENLSDHQGLFDSIEAKIVFGFIMFALSGVFLMMLGGTLGWIG